MGVWTSLRSSHDISVTYESTAISIYIVSPLQWVRSAYYALFVIFKRRVNVDWTNKKFKISNDLSKMLSVFITYFNFNVSKYIHYIACTNNKNTKYKHHYIKLSWPVLYRNR